MNDQDQNRIDRLDATLRIQAAETSALFVCVSELSSRLDELKKRIPDADLQDFDVRQRFLGLRKTILLSSLEVLEDSDPAKAARLNEIIDCSCDNFPFDYD